VAYHLAGHVMSVAGLFCGCLEGVLVLPPQEIRKEGQKLFIDYLKLTYLIPHDQSVPKDKGWILAQEIARKAKIYGEVKIDGNTHQSFSVYPEGYRVVLDWGGSVLPIDITEFLNRFHKYNDWTISRLDIAENIETVAREDIRVGQSKSVVDWFETSQVAGKVLKNWTGTGIGKRGKAGSYFRVYDCRKHKEGRAAKISRFGSFDFWRLEYELGREFLRRKGIDKFKDLNYQLLLDLWASETHKKGLYLDGTSEYLNVNQRDITVVEEELSNYNRFEMISRMVAKIDQRTINAVEKELEKRKKILDGKK